MTRHSEAATRAFAGGIYAELRQHGLTPAEMCMVAMWLLALTAHDAAEYQITPDIQASFWAAIDAEVRHLRGQ